MAKRKWKLFVVFLRNTSEFYAIEMNIYYYAQKILQNYTPNRLGGCHT